MDESPTPTLGSEEPTIVVEPEQTGDNIRERIGYLEERVGELLARVEGHEGKYHAPEPEEEPAEGEPIQPDAEPDNTHPWARRIGR